jgi:DNA helicase HerA-like ATPase
LSELVENLPKVGDAKKLKLALLFDDAAKVFIDKIEQIVRLICSKGVGIYFITQNPLDVPEEILGQLGLKIQHTLCVFILEDKKL